MEEDGFNYSLQDRDELDAKHRDLYERYKEGDQEAYEEAVELVKAEAERKGYAVKVYHGPGADGFNVAKADSSEQQNGEGNQAHGAGLYMAVSRDTADKYRENGAINNEFDYTIGGKNINDWGINLKIYDTDALYSFFWYLKTFGIKEALRLAKEQPKPNPHYQQHSSNRNSSTSCRSSWTKIRQNSATTKL